MKRSSLLMAALLIMLPQSMAITGSLEDISRDVTALVEKTSPSIVEINAERDFGLPKNTMPAKMMRSVGSGFVIDKEGYILTTAHVVSGAKEAEVQFSDGSEAKARIIGTDSVTNAAVLKVDKEGLIPLELGDSEKLKPGNMVVMINSQAGLMNSVSLGVIAGTDRKLGRGRTQLIQISGTVGPGASGGPVLDPSGKVIGVTTAMFSPTDSAFPFNMPNIFLLPINSSSRKSLQDLQDELEDLRASKAERHPDVQQKIREVERAKKRESSQAFPTDEVNYLNALKEAMAAMGKGDLNILSILKQLNPADSSSGGIRDVMRTSGSSSFAVPINSIKSVLNELKAGNEIARGWLGTRIREKDGKVVLDPEKGGPADKAGIKEGDVVLQADGCGIQSTDQFADYISSLKPEQKVTLLIERDGKQVTLTATLGKRPSEPSRRSAKSSSIDKIFQPFISQHPIDLEDADIKQVAKSLSDAYGKSVIVVEPEKITKKVTIHLKSADLEKALNAVCSAMDCQYTKDGDTYIIKPK